MIRIEIGPFKAMLGVNGNEVVRVVNAALATPWFDAESNTVINRERHIKACAVCSCLAKHCECGELQVLVNPIEVQSHLLEHDHDMYHHMTGTSHEGEEDE